MEESSPHHTAIGTRSRTHHHVQNSQYLDMWCGPAAGCDRAWRAAALTRQLRCKWLKKWTNPARTSPSRTHAIHIAMYRTHNVVLSRCGPAAGRNSGRSVRQHRPLKFEHPAFRNPEKYQQLTNQSVGLAAAANVLARPHRTLHLRKARRDWPQAAIPAGQLPGDRASAVPLQLPQMRPVGCKKKKSRRTNP